MSQPETRTLVHLQPHLLDDGGLLEDDLRGIGWQVAATVAVARLRHDQLPQPGAPGVGLLDLRGATILINGVAVGTTPLAADLFVEPGLRRVTARKAGYHDVSAELLFPAGGTAVWHTVLTPLVSAPPSQPESGGNVYLGIGTALTAVTLAGGAALAVIAHVDRVTVTVNCGFELPQLPVLPLLV